MGENKILNQTSDTHTHVLNTRPAHQSNNLSRFILESGGTVFHLPLITIEPTAFEPIKMDDFDIIIFLSANAVNYFFAHINHNDDHTHKIIAIGPATQNALIAFDFQNIICPNTFSSEGILEMSLLQDCHDLSIALICGENPKPVLNNYLITRGAFVKTLFCYRRKPIMYDMGVIFPELLKQTINTIIITSLENFTRLMCLFECSEHRAWILNKQLCVVSDALKAEALTAGFLHVIQAKNATDDAIMSVIRYNQ